MMCATPGVSGQPSAGYRETPRLTLQPYQASGLLQHLRTI